MDIWSKSKRSAVMARIPSKNTSPELALRRILHGMGFRFRIHVKQLPGKPDIVLPKYRLAILVHGCFWHVHHGCIDGKTPKSNTAYWSTKLAANVKRDKLNTSALKKAGWHVVRFWECDINKQTHEFANSLGAIARLRNETQNRTRN